MKAIISSNRLISSGRIILPRDAVAASEFRLCNSSSFSFHLWLKSVKPPKLDSFAIDSEPKLLVKIIIAFEKN